MRMRIPVIRLAMRRPTGMPHPGVGMQIPADKTVFQFCNLALLFVDPKIMIQKRYAAAVITPVLKSLQTFQYYRISLTWSDVSNNTAHTAKF